MIKINNTLCGLALLSLASHTSAFAQSSTVTDYTRPYGQSHGHVGSPYQGHQSQGQNRVVVNGIMQTGVGVSARLGAVNGLNLRVNGTNPNSRGHNNTYAGATAIGNQLNVNVNGRYNIVVVNAKQTNTGNVNASAKAKKERRNEND